MARTPFKIVATQVDAQVHVDPGQRLTGAPAPMRRPGIAGFARCKARRGVCLVPGFDARADRLARPDGHRTA